MGYLVRKICKQIYRIFLHQNFEINFNRGFFRYSIFQKETDSVLKIGHKYKSLVVVVMLYHYKSNYLCLILMFVFHKKEDSKPPETKLLFLDTCKILLPNRL